ncbi:amino acid synthesis family protein [Hoeflea sp. CAU 1731]
MSTSDETGNFAGYSIRKWFTQREETLLNETGKPADGEPVVKAVIAAAIRNPYAGRYSEDLSDIIDRSDKLGEEFGRRANALLFGETVESYGKACLVGMDGEYEHGNAFLTTFGANPVRESIGGGKAWVPSTGKIGAPGATIDIPLAFKDALYVRSHYDTISTMFSDAPRRDEILVIWAFATRGRLHARLGGLQREDVRGMDGLT